MPGFDLAEFNPMLANASRIRLDHASRQAMQDQVNSMHENMSALDTFRSVFPGFPDQSKLSGMFDVMRQSGFMPSSMVDNAQNIFNQFNSGGQSLGNNPMGILASLSGGIK